MTLLFYVMIIADYLRNLGSIISYHKRKGIGTSKQHGEARDFFLFLQGYMIFFMAMP